QEDETKYIQEQLDRTIRDEEKDQQSHFQIKRNNNEEAARERTQGNSSIDDPLICHDHEVNSVAKVDAENMEVAQHLEEYVNVAPLPLVGNW
ncbi:hypothetical protein PSY31_22735, partial [Shigella flexneri]|nr:hypothetical protein [Shigella flexneri]